MGKSPGRKPKKKTKPKLDIVKALSDSATALEGFYGRQLLLEARVLALEAVFVVHETRRGVNQQKLLKNLDALAKKIATEKLQHIGDTNPLFAETIDIRGLLQEMITELESEVDS